MTQSIWFTPGFQTIREIHERMDRGEISSSQFTQDFISAAKVSQKNAFLSICEERAMVQAQAADVLLKKHGQVVRTQMPLLGIPIAIKDNLNLEGVLTTCASKMLENYRSPYTATAVKRLESAGGVIIGKTNLDEFAMGGSNENSAFGAVQHPTHPDRVPGGSSGGSAVAVRAGLCVAALGTDTGGSIRLPAHYCGIVALKPTYGRISRFGQVAFASSLDQIGPMTQSVEDAALLLDVMSGKDPLDSTSSNQPPLKSYQALQAPVDWRGLRVGMPQEYFVDGLAVDVEKAVQASFKWMEAQGATVVPISLPHTSYAVAVYYLVAVSEASSNLARFDGVRFGVRPPSVSQAKDLAGFYMKTREGFGPEVKRRIILGTFALSAGYVDAYYKRACQVRRKIQGDFDQAFQKVDFIAGPVSSTTVFKQGEKISDPLQMYLNDLYTIPVNLAGLPALSVPCGVGSHGLPIGLHLIGRPFGEESLVSVAHAFFNAYGKKAGGVTDAS